jgi:hypothetical protein
MMTFLMAIHPVRMFGTRIVIHGMGQVMAAKPGSVPALHETEASDTLIYEVSGAFGFAWIVNLSMECIKVGDFWTYSRPGKKPC